MKHVKLFEQFINESTTDGTIESLIDATKLSMKMDIFNDELLNDVKVNFIEGIKGSLKSETNKLPANKRKEFQGYVNMLIGPLEKANTMGKFLGAMLSVSNAKNNIMDRLSIEEALQESKVLDWLKSIKNKAADWWDDNKYTIVTTILEMLAQLLVNILFAILGALLKSDDLEAPKIKFGGGKFGGGGASSKW